jgi:hypothetical protein
VKFGFGAQVFTCAPHAIEAGLTGGEKSPATTARLAAERFLFSAALALGISFFI